VTERAGGKHGDSRTGNRDRGPLQPAQALVEHEPAEQDVRKRVEIISEARRQDVAAGHGVHVEQPVDADQDGGDREDSKRLRLGDRVAHPGSAPRNSDQQ
jgi:hypothetical protein